ncbi:MAG: hypothetical protein ACRYGA_05535 [Janthinobacterium lividum]
MSMFNWRGGKADAGGEGGTVPRPKVPSQSSFLEHWAAISRDGITASQFIEFLQPFADLDGISVSYVYNDADGQERVYHRRRDDDTTANPLSEAIRQNKISREEALRLALNDEGRVWIESNFIELK